MLNEIPGFAGLLFSKVGLITEIIVPVLSF